MHSNSDGQSSQLGKLGVETLLSSKSIKCVHSRKLTKKILDHSLQLKWKKSKVNGDPLERYHLRKWTSECLGFQASLWWTCHVPMEVRHSELAWRCRAADPQGWHRYSEHKHQRGIWICVEQTVIRLLPKGDRIAHSDATEGIDKTWSERFLRSVALRLLTRGIVDA